MRNFFNEDNLISAEVQNFYHDGAVALHTRSTKYGKLDFGQFVAVQQVIRSPMEQWIIVVSYRFCFHFAGDQIVWHQLGAH